MLMLPVIVCVIAPKVGKLINRPPLTFVMTWLPLMLIVLLSCLRLIFKSWYVMVSAAPAFFQYTFLDIERITDPLRMRAPEQPELSSVIVIFLVVPVVSKLTVASQISGEVCSTLPEKLDVLSTLRVASFVTASVSSETWDWSSAWLVISVLLSELALLVAFSFLQLPKTRVVASAMAANVRTFIF